MRGHMHLLDPSLTQNQGNVLGERPCVRQSRLYREHNGGNTMKELMGQSDLKWDTTQVQGAFTGGRLFDHRGRGRVCQADPRGVPDQQAQFAQQRMQGSKPVQHRRPQEEEEEEERRPLQDYGVHGYVGGPIGDERGGVVIDMDEGMERRDGEEFQNVVESMNENEERCVAPAGTRRGAPPRTDVAPTCQPVAYRAFRPGAGHANRQTYNIFTGK
uniref:Uncharacterized protein n=1 Tax=Trypanosoma congolense (strain IL3000) TaxID=1068625 RepID=G0US09_TRYCI|nr:conserved hypothetical protein [Trypanosoma congolense IL3000]